MDRERYAALERCLTLVEAQQRYFSRNGNLLEPDKGMEMAWDRERRTAEVLRKML